MQRNVGKAGMAAGGLWGNMPSVGAMWKGMGGAGRTAAVGAGLGGLYGGFSDRGSVMGGAMTGATLGLGGRMGRAGLHGWAGSKYAGGREGWEAFSKAVQARATFDYRGASMR